MRPWHSTSFDRAWDKRTRAGGQRRYGKSLRIECQILDKSWVTDHVSQVTGARFVSTFPLLHSILPSSNLLGVGKAGTNLLDGGAPFYNVYTCKDGGWMSVGCLEPHFFKIFIDKFGGALPKDFKFENDWRPTPAVQRDVQQWSKMRAYFRQGFLTGSRDYWTQVFHGMHYTLIRFASVSLSYD